MLRAGTRQLIGLELGSSHEVEEFGSAQELMMRFAPGLYRLLLLDLSLPDRDGLSLLPHPRFLDPNLCIAIFSVHDGSLYRQRAADLGADALVSKRDAPETLITTIRSLLETPGQRPSILNEEPVESIQLGGPLQVLSERESEVFLLLVRGHSVQRIARVLDRSEKTVFAHRASIHRKLGTAGDVELALWAKAQGVV